MAERVSEAAKLAAFDPGKLARGAPELGRAWGMVKARHDFDQRHPILRRLARLPLLGGWYRKARRRHVLRASGQLVF